MQGRNKNFAFDFDKKLDKNYMILIRFQECHNKFNDVFSRFFCGFEDFILKNIIKK